MHTQGRVVVIGMGGMHGADDGEIINATGNVGKQRTHLGPAFTMRRKFPLRSLEIDTFVAGAVFDFRMVGLYFFPMVPV